jgi:hypothetical protein
VSGWSVRARISEVSVGSPGRIWGLVDTRRTSKDHRRGASERGERGESAVIESLLCRRGWHLFLHRTCSAPVLHLFCSVPHLFPALELIRRTFSPSRDDEFRAGVSCQQDDASGEIFQRRSISLSESISNRESLCEPSREQDDPDPRERSTESCRMNGAIPPQEKVNSLSQAAPSR